MKSTISDDTYELIFFATRRLFFTLIFLIRLEEIFFIKLEFFLKEFINSSDETFSPNFSKSKKSCFLTSASISSELK